MARSRRTRTHRPVGFTRQPRTGDLMTPEYHRLFEGSLLAERAGDAATALELHGGVPMFARGAHRVWLTQLASLSEEMAPWMWARWAHYQCGRAEGRHRSGEIQRDALHYAAAMFYPDRLDSAFCHGGDPVKVLAHLFVESWVYHQLCAYELGGLEVFLDELAAGLLAANAGTAREWARAPMGGFRLEDAGPGVLTVADLRAERSVELLDLGAALHAGEGGWLLGRVVPSGTEPAWMFDSRPLGVDERTAREVAADPSAAGWISALRDALDDGRVDPSLLDSEDREMVTDVLSLSLVERATPPHALQSTLRQLSDGRDEVGRAAFRILREVASGRFGPDTDAPYVAAAVVNAHAHPEAWRQLATHAPPETWAHWAELVPDPARSRLLRLASSVVAA